MYQSGLSSIDITSDQDATDLVSDTLGQSIEMANAAQEPFTEDFGEGHAIKTMSQKISRSC